MSEAWVALMAAAIAATISGAFGLWIQRVAKRSDRESSREQIEAGAFERAEHIYDNALARAKQEIDALVAKVNDAEQQLATLERELVNERNERRLAVEAARSEITKLRLELKEREATITVLRRVMVRKNLLPPELGEDTTDEGEAQPP